MASGHLGMAPFYWIGPRIASLGRKFGYVTQAQLVTGRFPSKRLSALLALLSLVAFVPYITLQMRGAGIVIEAVTEGHVPLWLGALVAYGIVIVYVLSAGAMKVAASQLRSSGCDGRSPIAPKLSGVRTIPDPNR